ncbi:hypothetical protein ABID20_001528 [Rhizobium alvei]
MPSHNFDIFEQGFSRIILRIIAVKSQKTLPAGGGSELKSRLSLVPTGKVKEAFVHAKVTTTYFFAHKTLKRALRAVSPLDLNSAARMGS